MLLALALVLLALYIIFTQNGVITQNGGKPNKRNNRRRLKPKRRKRRKRKRNKDKLIKKLGKFVETSESKVCRCNKALDKINNKLNKTNNLTSDEHELIRELAKSTNKIGKTIDEADNIIKEQISEVNEAKQDAVNDINTAKKIRAESQIENVSGEQSVIEVQDHIELTKNVLDNHNKRLKNLEKHLCELKSHTYKSNATLTDIKNKLQSRKDTKIGPKTINKKSSKVKQTVNVIKENCPVCPLYAETNPVNVLEVTGQGFGSIAPINN